MNFLIETVTSTALSVYAIIFNPDGRVWNTTLNAGAGGWQVYNSGNWAQYAIPLTEKAGSGYYSATYPAAITGVLTTEVVYANATPTLGDQPMGIGQSQGVSVAAVVGDSDAAGKMQRSASSMILGTVIAGTLTATVFTTDVVNANVNAYQGRSLLFATGNLVGQGGVISQYNPGTGAITVTAAFTSAPALTDKFVIS